jgi:hypothetical protein
MPRPALFSLVWMSFSSKTKPLILWEERLKGTGVGKIFHSENIFIG